MFNDYYIVIIFNYLKVDRIRKEFREEEKLKAEFRLENLKNRFEIISKRKSEKLQQKKRKMKLKQLRHNERVVEIALQKKKKRDIAEKILFY